MFINFILPIVAVAILVIVVLFVLPSITLGLVIIGERQVGIVVKRFSRDGRGLAPGQLIALNGEAGLQAETLAPGWHFGYWSWMFNIIKVPVVVIPQGEIGLVVAAAGNSVPPERILGKVVDCDKFQDARKFLMSGGEKGRQLGILTSGTYRINTAVFSIITARKRGVITAWMPMICTSTASSRIRSAS